MRFLNFAIALAVSTISVSNATSAQNLDNLAGSYFGPKKEYRIEVVPCSLEEILAASSEVAHDDGVSIGELCERTGSNANADRFCARIVEAFPENGGRIEYVGLNVGCLTPISDEAKSEGSCNKYDFEGAGWSWTVGRTGSMFARLSEGKGIEFKGCGRLRSFGECEAAALAPFCVERAWEAYGE